MAGGGDSGGGGRGGKRKLESELILTSFIDIFSLLIFFMIFNMVTNEIAAIQLQMGSEQAATTPVTEPVKEVPAELKIGITANTVELWDRGSVSRVPYRAEVDFDWSKVADFLKNARSKYPMKKDIIVQSRDVVTYGMVVRAMDYSLGEGFKEIVVMGAE
jgi:biopolymer transport protein TolR